MPAGRDQWLRDEAGQGKRPGVPADTRWEMLKEQHKMRLTNNGYAAELICDTDFSSHASGIITYWYAIT